MSEDSGTFEEWRVTGQPGHGYPPYEFVWSRRLTPHMKDEPGTMARAFVESIRTAPSRSGGIRTPWLDGPHLSRRTVTVRPWEDEEGPRPAAQ